MEDLKSMVLSEVASYNSVSGEKSISVDKLEADGGKVTVAMTFAGAEKYADFNEKVLFSGTVAEAYGAGYDLNVTLSSTKKDGGQIGKEEILAMNDYGIIILEEPIAVMTQSKIVYASSNVEVLSAKSAKVTDTEQSLAYLVIQ